MQNEGTRPDHNNNIVLLALLEECNPDASNIVAAYMEDAGGAHLEGEREVLVEDLGVGADAVGEEDLPHDRCWRPGEECNADCSDKFGSLRALAYATSSAITSGV